MRPLGSSFEKDRLVLHSCDRTGRDRSGFDHCALVKSDRLASTLSNGKKRSCSFSENVFGFVTAKKSALDWLTSCKAEDEGALFGQIAACPGSGNLDVAPFLDSEGKPQAKRIKFRMSVEHEDLKTGAASK